MNRSSMLSFLDLVCCAFGAALLIFLIASSAGQSARPVPKSGLVVVRAFPVGEAHGEVGILFLRPGALDWECAGDKAPGVVHLAARSDIGSGGEAILVLVNPEAGTWEFKPYLVNVHRARDSRKSTSVTLDITGENVLVLGEPPPPAVLLFEGNTGQIVRARLDPRDERMK